MAHPQTRVLSTAARVHPCYLPYLCTASNPRGLKWTAPLLVGAVAGAGYAISSQRNIQHNKKFASKVEADRLATERGRQQEALADAYGDRESLDSLEQAVRLYEAHREHKNAAEWSQR